MVRLDTWQKDFLSCPGDKILCTGRQVGKSMACSIDCGDWAVANGGKNIVMIAPTERQAFALFNKTLDYLALKHKGYICSGKDRPTKTTIKLRNGTTIWCLPTGLSGLSVRFITIHRLYIDEASRVPDEVMVAVVPTLLTTGGCMILLSTPAGRQGWFYDCWQNKDNAFESFTRFSIDSEKCIRDRKICKTWTSVQLEYALKHLEMARARMTALQYAQEYMGEFVEELYQFFPSDLIRSCMRPLAEVSNHSSSGQGTYFLGVDVAGMGSDDTVLFSLMMDRRKRLWQHGMQVFKRQRTTDTVKDILVSDLRTCYKKIYIDDGGMGVGVFDPLLANPQTRRKVVSINNSARSIDKDGRKKKLLKEDLYNNLLYLMEQGMIVLADDDRTFHSLKSVQAEYTAEGNLRLFGNYTHIVEALIRAAWCYKDKHLNIWIA